MNNIKTFTLSELQQLQENNYDTVREAVADATGSLAEKTGFMALHLVALQEGTALWLTPEGKFLRASFGLDDDGVMFENIVILELDDQQSKEDRKAVWRELVESLENGQSDRADALFNDLQEGTIYRIIGHKVGRHRYNPYLGRAMKRARRAHRATYMIAAHRQSTKIKRARTFRRNKIAGLHRQLRVVRTSYDALDTALGGVKTLLPEWKKMVASDPVVETVSDLDRLFALRRFKVKSGSLTECKVPCKKGKSKKTTLSEVLQRVTAPDYTSAWKKISDSRVQVANEHKRISFREKVESIRHQMALANDSEASALVKEMAIENPSLLYLKLDELASQVGKVFEVSGKKGHASDIARALYKELRVQNKARVTAIVEASVPLFEADESVPEDMDDAFAVVTDRLYTTVDETENMIRDKYVALVEVMASMIEGVKAEVKDYADDDVDKINGLELIEAFGEHIQLLQQAIDKSYPVDRDKLAVIIDEVHAVLHEDDVEVEKSRDDAFSSELSEAAGNDELEEMVESEGGVYTFNEEACDCRVAVGDNQVSSKSLNICSNIEDAELEPAKSAEKCKDGCPDEKVPTDLGPIGKDEERKVPGKNQVADTKAGEVKVASGDVKLEPAKCCDQNKSGLAKENIGGLGTGVLGAPISPQSLAGPSPEASSDPSEPVEKDAKKSSAPGAYIAVSAKKSN